MSASSQEPTCMASSIFTTDMFQAILSLAMQPVRLTAGACIGTSTPDIADAICTPTIRLMIAASSLAIGTASMAQSLSELSWRLWTKSVL